MKVAIIAPNILGAYLGPATVAYNTLQGFIKLQRFLEKKDIQITFLSLRENQHKEFTPNIQVIGLKRYNYPFRIVIHEIQGFIISPTWEQFDIVHSHSIYELLPWISKGIPTIFTLHGMFWREKEYGNKILGEYWASANMTRLKLCYPRLASLVAISPYVVNELVSLGFDVSKAEIIENPVSDEFFNTKKREENLILYPATIIPRKNQLGFLKAVRQVHEELRDFKIVLTGSGDPKYFNAIKEFIRKHKLKNVKFTGKIAYEHLIMLYSKASVVALTSFQETLPMAVLEALATGTPVIASNVGGIPYMVQQNRTGFLVNPNEPKDIAEKLLILASDKNTRKKMGRRARKHAEKRWKAEIIARKHLNLYLEVANQSPAK